MTLEYQIVLGNSLKTLPQLNEGCASFAVTSPPYYDLKDYLNDEQIGYGQAYEDYISDMSEIISGVHRALLPGCFFALNATDCVRMRIEGPFMTYPMMADFTKAGVDAGFYYYGYIFWHHIKSKSLAGSYPHPCGGVLHYDSEYIILFKKRGTRHKPSRARMDESKLTKDEWKKCWNNYWKFSAVKQDEGHGAIFPPELPRRLIKMYSYVGETVLEPFLGSGTTMKVCKDTRRSCIGLELNPEFVKMSMDKSGWGQSSMFDDITYVTDELIEGELVETDKFTTECMRNKCKEAENGDERPGGRPEEETGVREKDGQWF